MENEITGEIQELNQFLYNILRRILKTPSTTPREVLFYIQDCFINIKADADILRLSPRD